MLGALKDAYPLWGKMCCPYEFWGLPCQRCLMPGDTGLGVSKSLSKIKII